MCGGHVLVLKTKVLPASRVPEAKKERVYMSLRHYAVMRLRQVQVAELSAILGSFLSCCRSLFHLNPNVLPHSDGLFAASAVGSLICTYCPAHRDQDLSG